MNTQPPKTPERVIYPEIPPNALTVDEAMTRLKVARRTVQAWAQRGMLEVVGLLRDGVRRGAPGLLLSAASVAEMQARLRVRPERRRRKHRRGGALLISQK